MAKGLVKVRTTLLSTSKKATLTSRKIINPWFTLPMSVSATLSNQRIDFEEDKTATLKNEGKLNLSHRSYREISNHG